MKITKYFLSLAAAAGMIAGCQKPEMVQIASPENVVAPVLEGVADFEITKETLEEGKLTLKWSEADFGAKTQIDYAIEVAAEGSDSKFVLTSGINDTLSVAVPYKTLNNILVSDMELAPGVASKVNFYVSAEVGVYPKVYSAAVPVSVIPVESVIPESELYKSHVWVIGDYCGWDHGKSQFLYSYDSSKKDIYTGVVDFGDKAKNGFKLTGAANWDNGNWGTLEDANLTAEQAEVQLRNDGGSGNISCYSKRFYNFEFDKAALVLKVKNSFDQVGVVGDFTGWADGADKVMEYNPVLVRFYADVEIAADGGLKVRADGKWDLNWGATKEASDITEGPVAIGGENGSVKAGNYRIYLDINKGTIEANAKMYGKPEPGMTSGGAEDDKPAVPELKGWGVVGDLTKWADGADVAMTQAKAVWSAKDVELKKGEGWKLRKDGKWDNNRGAKGDVEPFAVTVGEALDVVSGGKNLTVPADGKYDIYFDEANDKLYVMAAGATAPEIADTWFLIGGINEWAHADMNYKMKKDGDFWVFKGLELKEAKEVKFATGSWDVQRGGKTESFSANAVVELSADGGSKNIKVAAGKYDVYLDVEGNKAYFMTDGKTPADAGEAVVTYLDASKVVVGFSGEDYGWGDPTDAYKATFVSKELTDEAKFAGTYVFKKEGLAVANSKNFKIRINGAWLGYDDVTLEGLTAIKGSDGNIQAGEGGTFNVEITFTWDGLAASEVKAKFSK